MTVLFDEIYVAGTLRELQYRGVKVEPGLTEDELRAVERAVGVSLPPDLALLLRAGLPSGEDFPDWRNDPEGEMRRARDWIAHAFSFDIEVAQWWFDDWGARPADIEAAKRIALEKLSSAPPLVPICSHRFMTTEPKAFGNPVLSVWQAVDTTYYGYDLAHYLHNEFGVPRPPWSARTPPHVPFWGQVFGLPRQRPDDKPELQDESQTDSERQWHVSLAITSARPPETITAALGLQPSRVEVDEEDAGFAGEDDEWETGPPYTWMLDSRLPISETGDPLPMFELESHIKDVLSQLGDSWMELVAVSGWADIELSARLPLGKGDTYEDDSDRDRVPAEHQQAYFDLDPEVMASLAQIRARLEVTYE